jgi:uncharacterized membrane protein
MHAQNKENKIMVTVYILTVIAIVMFAYFLFIDFTRSWIYMNH